MTLAEYKKELHDARQILKLNAANIGELKRINEKDAFLIRELSEKSNNFFYFLLIAFEALSYYEANFPAPIATFVLNKIRNTHEYDSIKAQIDRYRNEAKKEIV